MLTKEQQEDLDKQREILYAQGWSHKDVYYEIMNIQDQYELDNERLEKQKKLN